MNGQILSDRYKIIRTLGAGGMEQTYVAEDTQRPGNPRCVVKQLKPASAEPNFLVTARRLFVGEAEMLEKLGKHDQVPQLLAHFERGGEFYLVQEFIDGQPLSAELPLGLRWSESQVVSMSTQIASASTEEYKETGFWAKANRPLIFLTDSDFQASQFWNSKEC